MSPQRNWIAKALGMRATLDEEELEHEEVVLLVEGTNVFNQRVFCYAKVPFGSLREIKHKMDAGEKFDLHYYGSVLAAGLGEPSEELKKEMAEEYQMIPVTRKPSESETA